MNFLVKTDSSLDYYFEASHFHICDGIVYFYEGGGDIIWVIKDWVSFRVVKENER